MTTSTRLRIYLVMVVELAGKRVFDFMSGSYLSLSTLITQTATLGIY